MTTLSDAMTHVLWLIWFNQNEGGLVAHSFDGRDWRSFEALRRRGMADVVEWPHYNGKRAMLTDKGLALADEIFPAKGLRQRVALDDEERRRIWRAYLGGREPCRTCDGSGYNPRDRADHAHASAHCPTCKGTGE